MFLILCSSFTLPSVLKMPPIVARISAYCVSNCFLTHGGSETDPPANVVLTLAGLVGLAVHVLGEHVKKDATKFLKRSSVAIAWVSDDCYEVCTANNYPQPMLTSNAMSFPNGCVWILLLSIGCGWDLAI